MCGTTTDEKRLFEGAITSEDEVNERGDLERQAETNSRKKINRLLEVGKDTNKLLRNQQDENCLLGSSPLQKKMRRV